MRSCCSTCQLFLFRDGIEDELRLHRPLGTLPDLGVEVLLRLLLAAQVVLAAHADLRELRVEGLLARVDLLLEDGGRDRHLDAVDELVEHLVAGLDALLDLAHPADLAPQVVLELVEGVELAGGRREVVVELGELLGLHTADGRRDLSGPAGEVAGDQLGVEGAALTIGGAGDGVVEASYQRTGADFVRQAARLGAGHRLAVDAGRQVDREVVALLRRPVGGLQHGEAVTQPVELGVDVVIR